MDNNSGAIQTNPLNTENQPIIENNGVEQKPPVADAAVTTTVEAPKVVDNADVNPFEQEDIALQEKINAEKKADNLESAILQTTISALRVDRRQLKKCAHFLVHKLAPVYSNIAMETIPDASLDIKYQTQHKLSIAMGYTHTQNTENIALCAVKLPVGVSVKNLEDALKQLVGENQFFTKDYFRTSLPDDRKKFANIVQDLRQLASFNECANAANAHPYNVHISAANAILNEEEETVS